MTFPLSERMLEVQTPVIPAVAELIVANPGTISLGQGIVNYAPPKSIAEAIAQASDVMSTHRYGAVVGAEELRETLKAKLLEENQIQVTDAQRLVVTAGSNMAFMNAILAITDAEDEVIIMSPYYFNHEMAISLCHAKAVVVPTLADYQLDVPAIRRAISSRTKAIVTISPNNPTGAVYAEDDLRAIHQLCKEHQVYHISDEAYEYFHHEESEHFSPASIPGAEAFTISLFSLSKAYGMAGWRVGYMLIPAHLELSIKKAQDTNLICPPMMSQVAATQALKAGRAWCREQIAPLSDVRALVLEELAKLGDKILVPTPMGAFYVLIKIVSPELCQAETDMELVTKLIENHKVAVMPGSTFGIEEGMSLRIAYGALDPASVAEGMGRLIHGLSEYL